jgi:flap endonuclease-1
MGIKNLNGFLRKQCPQVFKKMYMKSLRGHKLAVDGHNMAYKYMSIAHSRISNSTDVINEAIDRDMVINSWYSLFVGFITKLGNHGITPIIVFDGESPVEKTGTKESRIKVRVDRKNKIDQLKAKIKEADILDNSQSIVDEVKKLSKYDFRVSKDDIEGLKNLLERIGIPVATSKTEGEKLCAILALNRICSGVYTTDTDTLVYGAPLVITGFDDGEVVNCVKHSDVLELLEIDHETFVDLCIMSGCDYNTNIPKISAGKAYKMLKEHKKFENIPSLPDSSCLNYDRCKQLFNDVDLESNIVSTKMFDLNVEKLKDPETKNYLSSLNLNYYMLFDCINNLTKSEAKKPRFTIEE